MATLLPPVGPLSPSLSPLSVPLPSPCLSPLPRSGPGEAGCVGRLPGSRCEPSCRWPGAGECGAHHTAHTSLSHLSPSRWLAAAGAPLPDNYQASPQMEMSVSLTGPGSTATAPSPSRSLALSLFLPSLSLSPPFLPSSSLSLSLYLGWVLPTLAMCSVTAD